MGSWCIAAVLLLCIGISSAISSSDCKPSKVPSFVVDYKRHTFLKDGCPFHYVSGSMHYSRVPYTYWEDRLSKMAAAGLDAVQVYIPWNVHESTSGVYDFSGQRDLVAFLQTAQRQGLAVILRGGPYICGEWDFGGLPPWLLQKNGSVVMRTMDPGFLTYVKRWFTVLLPKLKPLLYAAGGPILMLQVENEYGSYFACDHAYMDYLAKLFRDILGPDIVLFTTDGNTLGYLRCGVHKDLFVTVDFGPSPNASQSFAALRKVQPNGPLVNSEFYTGWLDYWGTKHSTVNTTAILNSLKQMLDLKASVNLYMFEGGTNFGYTSGADPTFNICPTSYDYDAPLSEAGDVRTKYSAIRALIMKYKNVSRPVPANTTKKAYGRVEMRRVGGVLDLLDNIVTSTAQSTYPMTMEMLGQNAGFILYRTRLTQDYPGDTLRVDGLRDRAHVFVGGKFRGLLDRKLQTSLTLSSAKGQNLELLIENQGHICYGTAINNGSKGLIANVTLRGDILTKWTMLPFSFHKLSEKLANHHLFSVRESARLQNTDVPAVFAGIFQLPKTDKTPADTFLNVTGWFKGQAFVNNFNLGRYWPVRGPQQTLYLPAPVLKPYPAFNFILMYELDHAPCGVRKRDNDVMQWPGDISDIACSVTLQDQAQVNGPFKPYKEMSPDSVAATQSRGRGN